MQANAGVYAAPRSWARRGGERVGSRRASYCAWISGVIRSGKADSVVLESQTMDSVRLDKWLWAARFYKTRALAARACELGRVLFSGQPAKPAREVQVGSKLRITNDSGEFEVEVLQVGEVRGPAVVAQTMYRESEGSRELRMKAAAERKASREFEQLPAGRPSKRDRRRIIQFRGRG